MSKIDKKARLMAISIAIVAFVVVALLIIYKTKLWFGANITINPTVTNKATVTLDGKEVDSSEVKIQIQD